MTLTLRTFCLHCAYVAASLVLVSGCTKKVPTVNPDKIRGAALEEKQREDAEAALADSNQLPEPSVDETPASAPPRVERTPTPGPTLTPPTPPETQLPTPVVVTPPSPTVTATVEPPKPPPAITQNPAETPISIFEDCVTQKTPALLGALESVASADLKPSQLSATRAALFEFCVTKIADKSKRAELEKFNIASFLAEESLKRFPEHENAIKFFKAIEDNASYKPKDKEKIYSAYGSGGEISTKNIQFFGKLEGAKASTNVISYLITSAAGAWSTRTFTQNGSAGKSTTLDLKSLTRTNIRFTFDFSPTQKNVYILTISDGASKIVANVVFKIGDLKSLRERKQVTITLTSDSWYKVQEAHLRNLIAEQAKELISMPFSLDRKQQNMSLVRTCNLKEETIACTDPDYSITAIVKTSATAAK